jgi:hypothetical protein
MFCDNGREELMGLLNTGDSKGEVLANWRARELVRGLYDHHDPELALEFVRCLGNNLSDPELPEKGRSLGRTLCCAGRTKLPLGTRTT